MRLYGAIDLHSNNTLETVSHRIVNPITLDTAWYRQFSGTSKLLGAGDDYQDHSTALILMGDWCGPKSDTDRKRKQGRVT